MGTIPNGSRLDFCRSASSRVHVERKRWFWLRVLHSLLCMRGFNESLHMPLELRKRPFAKRMNFSLAWDAIKALGFPRGPLIIIADELSKLCDALKDQPYEKEALSSITALFETGGILVASGFHAEMGSFLRSNSNRPINYIHLPPVDKATRNEFRPLKAELVKQFGSEASLPMELYELTKFSPGLLGLWLEMCQQDKSNKPEKIGSLVPPIVGNLKILLEHPKQGPTVREALVEHWRLVARAGPGSNSRELLPAVVKHDYYLHTSKECDEGVLNPFLLMHPLLKAQPFGDFLQRNVACLFKQGRDWTRDAKGKALEEIIVASLAIRVACMGDDMTLQRFVEATCGSHVATFGRVDDSMDRASSIVVAQACGAGGGASSMIPAPRVAAIEAFPCLWSYDRDAKPKSEVPYPNSLKRTREVEELLRGDTTVFRMTEKFNAGCDLGVLLALKNGNRALLLFESRYWSPRNSTGDGESTERESSSLHKAYLVLQGLMELEQKTRAGEMGGVITRNQITQVVFVYCCTNRVVEFVDSSQRSLGDLDQKWAAAFPQCTLSLHALGSSHDNSNEGWKSLLMQSLYYIVPDLDEHANVAAT